MIISRHSVGIITTMECEATLQALAEFYVHAEQLLYKAESSESEATLSLAGMQGLAEAVRHCKTTDYGANVL